MEIQSGEVDGNEKRRERGTSWLDEDDDDDDGDGDGMNKIDNNMGIMTMEGEESEPIMVSAKEEPTNNVKVRLRFYYLILISQDVSLS